MKKLIFINVVLLIFFCGQIDKSNGNDKNGLIRNVAKKENQSGDTMHHGIKNPTQNYENSNSPIIIIGASYAAGLKMETLAGRPLLNKGIGGQESHEMLARYGKDVIELEPKAVIIWGFINDIFRSDKSKMDLTIENIKKSYIKMVSLSKENNIITVLSTEVTMSRLPGFKEKVIGLIARILGKKSYQDFVNKHVMEVNQWLKTYALENNLLLLDLQAILSEDNNMRKMAYAKEDGSHISEKGYDLVAEYMQATLKKTFQ